MNRRRTYHHGDLPAALQRGVLDVIAESGIDAVTMAEVARRAAVTAAAPYRHYASLADLLVATGTSCYWQFCERMDRAAAAVPDDQPSETIYALIRAYFRYAADEPAASTLLFDGRLTQMSDDFAQLIRSEYDRIAGLAARAVGMPVEECRTLALNISALVLGHLTLHVAGFSPVSTADEAPDLTISGVQDLLAHALRTRTSASRTAVRGAARTPPAGRRPTSGRTANRHRRA